MFGEYYKLTPVTAEDVAGAETIQGKRKRLHDFTTSVTMTHLSGLYSMPLTLRGCLERTR